MITRQDVADLQPGDVIRVTVDLWPDVETVGPVTDDHGTLKCGPVFLRYPSGAVAGNLESITVISRAARPLYVNHERTEPVPGDVVQSAESDDHVVYVYASPGSPCPWLLPEGDRQALLYMSRAVLPARLRLLVDGATGQVVPQ